MINYTHRNSLSFIPGFAIAALLTFAIPLMEID